MSNLRLWMLLGIVGLLVFGCYEVKEDNKKRTVKINKLTGEVSVIDGDRIVKLKDENDIRSERGATQKLGETKTWEPLKLSIAGGTTVRLLTKWSDDNMYYQFFVDRDLRGKHPFGRLTLQFHDSSNFLVKEVPVSVSGMIGVVGIGSEDVRSLEYKGQDQMSKEAYQNVMSWNVSWQGFGK